MKNRIWAAALAAGIVIAAPALAENAPGITDTEILIGQTSPYSGPASLYSANSKVEIAYFQMINDQGGINGRKIKIISLDDGYNPAKTVELTRKLVEQDKVAFIFSTIGTPTNVAIRKYLNERKVPNVFVASGGDFWGDYQHYPWSIGLLPSYRVEANIYAKYILAHHPGAKVGLLYQNDDFGKDYLNGLHDGFGAEFDKRVVAAGDLSGHRSDGRFADRVAAKVPAPTCWSAAPRSNSARRRSAKWRSSAGIRRISFPMSRRRSAAR